MFGTKHGGSCVRQTTLPGHTPWADGHDSRCRGTTGQDPSWTVVQRSFVYFRDIGYLWKWKIEYQLIFFYDNFCFFFIKAFLYWFNRSFHITIWIKPICLRFISALWVWQIKLSMNFIIIHWYKEIIDIKNYSWNRLPFIRDILRFLVWRIYLYGVFLQLWCIKI